MTVTSTNIGTLITRTPDLHGGCPHIVNKGVTVRRIVSWQRSMLPWLTIMQIRQKSRRI
jgi:uncharacterized protein (DUF433 family)